MKKPTLPAGIAGIEVMKPLEMNNVRFSKKHTVIEPPTEGAADSAGG